MLVVARGPVALILAAGLWGFFMIMSVITSSMKMELVPAAQMGRWSGMLGLFDGIAIIPAPFIGGLIWRYLGPTYVFLIPVALDVALRLPLLATIPETLKRD